MLGFHNVRFPEDVSWGSAGGPEYKTQVFESFRGYEKRNIDWCQPLMHFNVSYGIKTDVQMLAVLSFFNARQGRAYGFRYKNWSNYRIVNRPIATGDGISTRLPIWKFYGFQGARTYKRLRKIVEGSVTDVGVNSIGGMVEGVDYNINYDEGEIALNYAPGYGVPVYASNLEFDEPVRFDVDTIQSVIDSYNSQSLQAFPLIGVKAGFTTGSIFAPDEDATGSDIFFDSVRLILNFDDTETPTTTIDQSEICLPVTMNGTATLTTSDFQHGNGAFDAGTAGYISVSGEQFNMDTMPFTLEVFAQQPTDGADQQLIMGKWEETATNRCWQLRYQNNTRQLQFVISVDGIAEEIVLNYPWTPPTDGKFDYITIDRTTTGFYVLRINGIVQQTAKNTSSINSAVTNLVVGGLAAPGGSQGPFRALLDSVRITIGRTRNAGFETIDVPAPYPV